MAAIEALKKKIDLTEDLHKLVSTMKTLAAVGIREYEHQVESVNAFYETVEMSLQILMMNVPTFAVEAETPGRTRTGILVFGSDQGLCGPFNERIGSFAWETLKQTGVKGEGCTALAVGSRVAPYLMEAGCDVQDCFTLPTSPRGFSTLVQSIFQWMDEAQEKQGLNHFLLFHNRPVSGSSFEARKIQLLPFEMEWVRDLPQKPWPNRCLPTFTQDRHTLFSALVRNYLSILLYRALAESLMSENLGRLVAMQTAEKNIEEHLDELRVQYQDQRQTQITEELLDIVGGFEAIEHAQKPKRRSPA